MGTGSDKATCLSPCLERDGTCGAIHARQAPVAPAPQRPRQSADLPAGGDLLYCGIVNATELRIQDDSRTDPGLPAPVDDDDRDLARNT